MILNHHIHISSLAQWCGRSGKTRGSAIVHDKLNPAKQEHCGCGADKTSISCFTPSGYLASLGKGLRTILERLIKLGQSNS
jgi:hypothetical protein